MSHARANAKSAPGRGNAPYTALRRPAASFEPPDGTPREQIAASRTAHVGRLPLGRRPLWGRRSHAVHRRRAPYGEGNAPAVGLALRPGTAARIRLLGAARSRDG